VKLNGTHHLLHAYDVNILGGSMHAIKKNTEASVVASKESGLLIKLSTWLCLKIRMQDDVTI